MPTKEKIGFSSIARAKDGISKIFLIGEFCNCVLYFVCLHDCVLYLPSLVFRLSSRFRSGSRASSSDDAIQILEIHLLDPLLCIRRRETFPPPPAPLSRLVRRRRRVVSRFSSTAVSGLRLGPRWRRSTQDRLSQFRRKIGFRRFLRLDGKSNARSPRGGKSSICCTQRCSTTVGRKGGLRSLLIGHIGRNH